MWHYIENIIFLWVYVKKWRITYILRKEIRISWYIMGFPTFDMTKQMEQKRRIILSIGFTCFLTFFKDHCWDPYGLCIFKAILWIHQILLYLKNIDAPFLSRKKLLTYLKCKKYDEEIANSLYVNINKKEIICSKSFYSIYICCDLFHLILYTSFKKFHKSLYPFIGHLIQILTFKKVLETI